MLEVFPQLQFPTSETRFAVIDWPLRYSNSTYGRGIVSMWMKWRLFREWRPLGSLLFRYKQLRTNLAGLVAWSSDKEQGHGRFLQPSHSTQQLFQLTTQQVLSYARSFALRNNSQRKETFIRNSSTLQENSLNQVINFKATLPNKYESWIFFQSCRLILRSH